MYEKAKAFNSQLSMVNEHLKQYFAGLKPPGTIREAGNGATDFFALVGVVGILVGCGALLGTLVSCVESSAN